LSLQGESRSSADVKLPTIARLFLNVAVFAVAFAGAALLLGVALPMAEMTNITSKHRYIAAHRKEIDVLFIGSSQFFHQIIPREFDAAHRMTPLQRSSTAQDVARAVRFLLDAKAITGTTLLVDGGQHLQAQNRDVMFLAREPNQAP